MVQRALLKLQAEVVTQISVQHLACREEENCGQSGKPVRQHYWTDPRFNLLVVFQIIKKRDLTSDTQARTPYILNSLVEPVRYTTVFTSPLCDVLSEKRNGKVKVPGEVTRPPP